MPAPSWRDKYRGGDKKATARANKKKSKEQFANWIQSKIKKGKEKTSQKKGSRGFGQDDRGAGRGADRGAGRGAGRGADRFGRGRGVDRGAGKGRGRGVGDVANGSGNEPLAVESGEAAGASKALVERLLATKQRLLSGNAEAAKSGAVRAEPGAWAAIAGRSSASSAAPPAAVDMPAETEADGADSSRGRGRGRGSPSTGRLPGRGRGLAQPSAGRGSPSMGRGSSTAAPVRTQAEREELFSMNKKIDEHAKAKDLAAAKRVLAELEERGWANAYTYATAVNAFCRCGDWMRAEEALASAERKRLFQGGSGSTSGVIARTSMLRGYCEVARNLSKARELLARMEQEQKSASRPNTRSANTFLRGCMQLGAVQDAEALLKRMEDDWSAESDSRAPDASSYEPVVTLLCQALRHKKARKLAERCCSKIGISPGSGGMFLCIARAAAVCGDWDALDAAAARARELLTKEEQTQGTGSAVIGSGGKRGKEAAADVDGARTRSFEVFKAHRREELLLELKEVEVFARKRRSPDLKCLYMRTLIFEDFDSGAGTKEHQVERAAGALCRRLCERFGLESEGSTADAVKRTFEAALHANSLPPAKRRKKRRRQSAEHTPGQARLNLGDLFTASSGEIRPVNLELCSGGGEWLLAQAARDPASCWVACELRLDRAAKCFQRIALRKLASPEGNAGLIGGDAREALERRLTPASCARLFINHPEPPHQTDLEAAAASAPATHLLTADFLHGACAFVLQPGGILTICTDSPEYGRWLLNTVAAAPLTEVFEDALQHTEADQIGRLAKAGGVRLRVAAPPPEVCGAEYSGDIGASYFQRLKQSERGSRGQDEKKRYFLCLRRL